VSQNVEMNTGKTDPEVPEKRDNAMMNLLINLLIPTVIMVKFSSSEYLGSVNGLLIALAFPFIYGIYDFIKKRKMNYFSLIGLSSIGMTGGIGLFELDKNLMVLKETAIPAIFGIVIMASEIMKKPLIRGFLSQMIDMDKLHQAFASIGKEQQFELKVKRSSYLLGSTFFLSAILNFGLAIVILKGNPGSEEFTQSLGKMTFLSFPVITLPMMIMFAFILYYLFGDLKETQLSIEDVIKQ
jgi:hypothetical protein